jgi:hypothetical protein
MIDSWSASVFGSATPSRSTSSPNFVRTHSFAPTAPWCAGSVGSGNSAMVIMQAQPRNFSGRMSSASESNIARIWARASEPAASMTALSRTSASALDRAMYAATRSSFVAYTR